MTTTPNSFNKICNVYSFYEINFLYIVNNYLLHYLMDYFEDEFFEDDLRLAMI